MERIKELHRTQLEKLRAQQEHERKQFKEKNEALQTKLRFAEGEARNQLANTLVRFLF